MDDADQWAAQMEAQLEGLGERERAAKMQEMQDKLYAEFAAKEVEKDRQIAAKRKVTIQLPTNESINSLRVSGS
jgi:hypothetical protein